MRYEERKRERDREREQKKLLLETFQRTVYIKITFQGRKNLDEQQIKIKGVVEVDKKLILLSDKKMS